MKTSKDNYDDKDYDEETDEIDNKLELLKYATKVLSRGVKKDITPDFIMAKFNNLKDKEAIIEMTNNAYFCKRTLQMMKKRKEWTYNNTTKTWTQKEMTEDKKEEINQITEKMFDTFMTRMSMTALLNRNVKNNHILRLISGFDTEEDMERRNTPTEAEEKTKIRAIWDKITGKRNEEEE